MKTKISLFLICLSLLVCAVSTDTMAQSPPVTSLIDSVLKVTDVIFDRLCCPSICNEFERPEDCIARVSDATICGECVDIRTGEVGIYTQDLNEPHPDTTFADALGNLIIYNNRIGNEITTIVTKQMILRKSMRSFEMKLMLRSIKPTRKEKMNYEAALKTADIYEADLAKLQKLQSAIFKLSSDLFLHTLSNQFKKVE